MSHLQYPPPGAAVPPSSNGPAKLWVLQGFSSPTTPGGALNGISNDFANIHVPKTPKTPKTPKGVSVPSRDSNFTELGFPNWVSIFDGILRKVTDETHYGNCLGLDGSAGAAAGGSSASASSSSSTALLTAQSVHDLLQSVVGAHLPAWKAFLNNSLRATPSALPNSPNPLSISGPIPPLSQQLLLQSLASFLSAALLPHQLAQVVAQLSGQNHYILGRVLRGAAFPVDTHVRGEESGGSCGIRMHPTPFLARIAVMKSFMRGMEGRHAALASAARSQQHGSNAAAAVGPVPQPIFYLSPSFATAIGYPESLPRLCWELGVSASSFKILPLTPALDESILASLPRGENSLTASEGGGDHARPRAGSAQASSSPMMSPSGGAGSEPNPFLSYSLDSTALEADVVSDFQAWQNGSSPAAPLGVFLTLGNVAGLDLPYEYDNLREVARVAARFGLFVHAEGTSMFPPPAAAGEEKKSSASAASAASEVPATSLLFESVDSILLSPGAWLGLTTGPALVAWRNPAFLGPSASARNTDLWNSLGQTASQISPLGGGAPSAEEFSSTLALWFNLIQIHAGSFPTLLHRLSAKLSDKVSMVRRVVAAQNFPTFIAPVGEGDEDRAAYSARLGALHQGHASLPLLPPSPSHPHLFFALSTPAPWQPRHFHMDRSALNSWISSRLSARISAKQGDYVSHSKVFGLSLLPVQHFDRVGLMYSPAPVSIWSSDATIEEEVTGIVRLLGEVISPEIALIESQGRLRAEWEELLAAEAPEFLYVPAEGIQPVQGVYVGLGGVRFVPPAIPEHHLAEVGNLLNEALVARSAVTPHWGQNAGGAAGTGAAAEVVASMYKPGRTIVSLGADGAPTSGGDVCTVLELSELVVRKGLRDILAELKSAAARLEYPKHITDDVAESLRQGIRAAEEKISTKSAEAYRPTSVLRWVPLVGSVLNWVAPAEAKDHGQSFDMKSKELSSIKYSYSSSGGAGSTPSSKGAAPGAVAGAGAAQPSLSRKGSSTSINLSASGGTPLATPSPLSSVTAGGATPVSASSAITPTSLPGSSSGTANTSPSQGKRPAPLTGAQHPSQQQQQQQQHSQNVSASAAAPVTLGRPPLPPSMQHHAPFSSVPVHVGQPAFQQPLPQQVAQQQQTPPQHPRPLQQQTPVSLQQHQPAASLSPPQPQQQQQQPAPVFQQQPVPQQPVASSFIPPPPPPQPLPPVKVTLDEADKSFVDLLNAAPRSLTGDQIALLTRGADFLAYFPLEPEDNAPAPSGPPATSVTKLHLFLEPRYVPSPAEASELGVIPGAPVSLLCWCEPGVQRYVQTDQAVGVEQVSALHLGASALFPRQALRHHCFSLITQHVQLHLEADAPQRRRDWFLALYTLVSQAPAIQEAPAAPGYAQPQQVMQFQHQQQQLQSNTVGSSSVSPPTSLSSTSPSTSVSPASLASSNPASLAAADASLARARALLENGLPFVVFVLDRVNADVTTRHEVLLWYRPASVNPTTGAPVAHSLCWCRRGGALEFSPARCLPLNRTVQICMGKQTKAFRNPAAQSADPASAFSVMVEKSILNLEAAGPEERARWLEAFHQVMSAAGKKRVFEQEQGAAPALQGQQQQAQQQQAQQ